MLFAMPYRSSSLSLHFAKAPQIMLWESQTNTKRIINVPKSSTHCEHKKQWNKTLQDNKVDAVIVRQIGTNMLDTLFKQNVRVLSAPRDFDPEAFDVNQLTPVTQIDFARPSTKRNQSCCSKQDSAHVTSRSKSQSLSHQVASKQRKSTNKLSPRAMNHLSKVFKLTENIEKKQ